MKFKNFVVSTSIALALSACGGGSDSPADGISSTADSSAATGSSGGSSSDPLPISQENGKALASDMYDMSESASSAGSDTLSQTNSQLRSAVSKSTDLGLKLATQKRLQTRATSSESMDCTTGSMTLTNHDNNDNQQIDAGDSLVMQFDQCNLVFGSLSMDFDGKYTLSVHTGSLENEAEPVAATLVYENVRTTDPDSGPIEIDGTIHFENTPNGSAVTTRAYGDRLTITSEGQTGSWRDYDFVTSMDYSNQAYTENFSADISGSGVEFTGSATLTTPITFQGIDPNPPTIGTMRLENSAGAYILVNADTDNPDTVLLSVFDGSASISEEISWTEFQAQ